MSDAKSVLGLVIVGTGFTVNDWLVAVEVPHSLSTDKETV